MCFSLFEKSLPPQVGGVAVVIGQAYQRLPKTKRIVYFFRHLPAMKLLGRRKIRLQIVWLDLSAEMF